MARRQLTSTRWKFKASIKLLRLNRLKQMRFFSGRKREVSSMFSRGSIIRLAIRGRTSKKPASKSNIPNQNACELSIGRDFSPGPPG